LSATTKQFLLSLIPGKVFSGVERELAFGLGLVVGREILLELGMQMLGKLVVLTRMKGNLLDKALGKLLRGGRVRGDTEVRGELRARRGHDRSRRWMGCAHGSLGCTIEMMVSDWTGNSLTGHHLLWVERTALNRSGLLRMPLHGLHGLGRTLEMARRNLLVTLVRLKLMVLLRLMMLGCWLKLI
jgi:hypothetical protein